MKQTEEYRQTENKPHGQAAPSTAETGVSKKKKKRKIGFWRSKKMLFLLLLLLVLGGVGVKFYLSRSNAKEETVDAKNLGTVQRGEISSELTSSGSLAAKDSYEITSLVSGEITSANFEEGDQVEKGQVLYTIDPTDINQELSTAQKNVETAQRDLEDAQKNYEDAKSDYNNGVYTSKYAGYIKDLKLTEGTKAGGQNGTEIATLYDDTTMELRLPFLNVEADAIPIGADVVVTVNDTGESLPGKVTEKSALEETLDGGTLVKYVTLIVSNPGGLSPSDSGSAAYGDIRSAADGSFKAYTEKTLNCDLPDAVEVAEVLVTEGQYVSVGTPLFRMSTDGLSEILRSYEKQADSAESQLSSAQDKLVQLQENLDEYTITAPISGQVITKTSKAGDKLSAGGNKTTTMAIIYDLSELQFEMSIDEIDISKVAVGQEVEVTADAFDGSTFTGHVTNVSMNASTSNGVTTYPVTVRMDSALSSDGENKLLPGMNVDGTIILEKAENVLYIPSNALQRGDIVYVKDSSLTEAQKSGVSETKPADAEGNSGQEVMRDSASSEKEEKANTNAEEQEQSIGTGLPDNTSEQAGAEQDADSNDMAGGKAKENGAPSGNGAGNAPSGIGIPEGFTAVKVETGLVTDDYVEITSGLEEGQEVYVKESESSQTMQFGMGMGGPGGGMGGGPGGGMGGGPRG